MAKTIKHSTTYVDGTTVIMAVQLNAAHTKEADCIQPADVDETGVYTMAGFVITGDGKVESGADVIVYSDAGITEVARIDGATGNITTSGTVDGADVSALASASHARSHTLVSTSDHTSAVTVNKHFKADASGLPVEGANTDAEISAAVTASHAAVTVAGAPLTLSTQQITFNKSTSHFDLSGNDLILKAAGHGTVEHGSTVPLAVFGWDHATTIGTSLTKYLNHAGSVQSTDLLRVPVLRAGVMRNLFVVYNANGITSNSTFTLLVNDNPPAGGPVVTLGSGVLTGSDIVNTIAVVAGDQLSLQVQTGTTGTTIGNGAVFIEETAA